MSAELGSLTTVQVAERPNSLIVAVPLGSCEQHGPHLPLDTDSAVAAALCDSLCAHRGDVVVGPLVGMGASGEHAGFAGTLSVGTGFLAAYLTEVVRSARDWSRGVVLVSGHGGNLAALHEVSRTATHEGDSLVVFVPAIDGADAHAGRTETSLMLAINGARVRHNEMVAGNTSPMSVLEPALRSGGVAAVSPNGVLGDPLGATAAEGRALLDQLGARLRAEVAAAFGDVS